MKLNSYENQIHVVNDSTNVLSIMKNIAESGTQEDAFYTFDVEHMLQKHNEFKTKLPRVSPFYAVKCNDNEVVLQILAALGLNFDCASKAEIQKILDLGVHPERIIFANPAKLASHIRYAAAVNVDLATFDNEAELYKYKKLHPTGKLLLRIRSDASKVQCPLGVKYGCDIVTEAPKLLEIAAFLRLNVVGIAFHVGSGCGEPDAYSRSIAAAYELFNLGHQLGFNMQILDIGGGFPGDKNTHIDEIAGIVNKSLDDYFPVSSGVRVIAEPGRYYVSSAFTLAAYIHSKREINDPLIGEVSDIMYYINDGVYGSFNSILYDHAHPVPLPLCAKDHCSTLIRSSIWGPTCDGLDLVVDKVFFPVLEIGDWVTFENMGAYTIAAACTFNGFPIPKVYPVIKESAMLLLKELCMTTENQFMEDSKIEPLKIDHFAVSEDWAEENSHGRAIFSDIFTLNEKPCSIVSI